MPEAEERGSDPLSAEWDRAGLSDSGRQVSLFSHLTDRQRELIRSKCREISASRGSVILHQAEDSSDLYFILSGRVMVCLIHEDGRTVVLDYLKDGDFFGELSVLDGRSRSAMVTAVTDVRMLFLSREVFLNVLRENAQISIKLLAVMATRLRKSNETIESLTFLDVAGRVSKVLIDLAVGRGERLPGGYIKIKRPTHQAIAESIGASREAVTKALKSMVSNGLISAKGREIMIPPKHFENF